MDRIARVWPSLKMCKRGPVDGAENQREFDQLGIFGAALSRHCGSLG